ncbi:flagellar biosynthetic protein FliR [Novosphingobium sp. AP12]|uniref:flagellar biosynthetic protein FliR n=1 Tax=Novosphingobium sp. AP12 TaxID=1144305 RepID=UPI000271DDB5|nr:flagellar biosynthetic protein FliR [Novosphingobium sp. AP12]EJL24645.1 flagellar biosynthetic protein FliR [Novosphingobium sp. AP12]
MDALDLATLLRLPIDTAAFLILFCRVGAVIMLLPAFSEDAVPPQIRLVMALGFTFGMYGMLEPRVTPALHSGILLPLLVIGEVMVGLAIGMVVRILFSAAAIAGAIAAQQVGLSSALVVDPSMGGQAPLLSRLIGLAAVVVCMGAGVHHLWIASIFGSYATFPVGGMPNAADFAHLAVSVTGQALALGVSLAAPLILYGMLFNLGLGLAARVAPSIQVFFIAQPLNLLLGMSVLAMSIGAMLTAFAAAMTTFMQSGWKL